jgi:DNA polymerase III subunit epsilon
LIVGKADQDGDDAIPTDVRPANGAGVAGDGDGLAGPGGSPCNAELTLARVGGSGDTGKCGGGHEGTIKIASDSFPVAADQIPPNEHLFVYPAGMAPAAPVALQRSFDDLGTPLHDVTFCVIDLETTGGSRNTDAITEIAAVRYRGGEQIDSLVTLVNPGVAIPPTITYLTGITEAMVAPAPTIEPILAALIEFIRADDVIVGHNVGFDIGFLDAAFTRAGYPRLQRRVVDTVRLARRLLRDEVPDCRLGTLAGWLGLEHQPCHRALADVEATADLLHLILERVSGFGITGLDDLLDLPTVSGHPEAKKLSLTTRLPRSPGVYLFRDRGGTVVYVGKATNLRARVRQYFGHDDRRKVVPMLHITHCIDHIECETELQAAILEVRLIQQHRPRFNRVATRPESYAYLRVGGTAVKPKLASTRSATPPPASWLLGPFHSAAAARSAGNALQAGATALPDETPLTQTDVFTNAARLLTPIADRLLELAQLEQFEEAGGMRDDAGNLSRAIVRQGRSDALRRVPRIVLQWHAPERAHVIELQFGRLVIAPIERAAASPGTGPIPVEHLDEFTTVIRFLDRHANRIRIIDMDTDSNDDGLAWPIHRPAGFSPRRSQTPERPATRQGDRLLEQALLPSPRGHRAGADDHRRRARRTRGRNRDRDRRVVGRAAAKDPRGSGIAIASPLPLDSEP